MKKNGFVFVETIVSVIILTSALLLLYTSFNKILQSEKTRVYYDDVNYIYRTFYLKMQLQNLNFNAALTDLNTHDDKSFLTIGLDYANLFVGYDRNRTYISNLIQDFNVSQMVILKENKIDELKSCNKTCSLDNNCENYELCSNLYSNLSEELITYIDSIYIDISSVYVFVVEYTTCNSNNTSCRNYYSWVSV